MINLQQIKHDLQEAFNDQNEEQFQATLQELDECVSNLACQHEFISSRGEVSSCSKCGLAYKEYMNPCIQYQ